MITVVEKIVVMMTTRMLTNLALCRASHHEHLHELDSACMESSKTEAASKAVDAQLGTGTGLALGMV